MADHPRSQPTQDGYAMALFEGKKKTGKLSDEPSTDELYREIGRLSVERDFLSRKLDQ